MCKNCLTSVLAVALVVSCGAATVEKQVKKEIKPADTVVDMPVVLEAQEKAPQMAVQDVQEEDATPVCHSCHLNTDAAEEQA
jgi:hypothetical protein